MEFLLISMSSLMALALLTFTKVKITPSKTLSWHIARHKSTVVAAHVLLPLAGLMLGFWVIGSGLTISLKGLLLIVAVGFALMGLIPYGLGPRRDKWHDRVAWISAFAGMIFALSSAVLGISVCLAVLSLAVQLLFAGNFWIARNYRLMLAGQVLYFTFFYLLLGSIALG